MVLHDAERIARDRLGKNIHVREHCAQRRGKDCDSFLASGKKSFAEERARDSVSYRVHEGFKTAEVYTIHRASAISSRSGCWFHPGARSVVISYRGRLA